MGKIKTIKIVLQYNVAQWAAFLSENRYVKAVKPVKTLIIDFSDTYFIFPHHLVSLACLIEEYYVRKVNIKFRYTNNEGLAGLYLKKINFYNYWNKKFNRNNFQNIQIDSTITLWKLDRERLSGFATYAQNFFETHFLKSKELLPLNIAIVEACNNILDHSNSKINGFILTQYYKDKKILMISICDFGVGIPKRINDYRLSNNEAKIHPCDTIDKAFEKRFTTKSFPYNAGLGLDAILSNVKNTKGELHIVSKNACVKKHIGKNDEREVIKPSFPGTHLVISLGTEYLQDKDVEIAEELNIL